MSLVSACITCVLVHISCLTLAAGEWTGWVSEEGGSPKAWCNGLVTGMKCSGGYCDNMAIHCDQRTVSMTGSHKWTSWFSEESNGHTCAGAGYITGIRCRGKNCDDFSLRCSSISKWSKPTNCRWSQKFSDGTKALQYNAGTYLRGLRCYGKYCDDMQAYVCDSQPEQCLVTSVKGYWKQGRTIASAQTETLSWGMEIQHETSRSKEWSKSMSSTVSAGFSVKAFSFSAEISHTMAESVTEAVSESLTSTKTHEIQYEYMDANIGKTLWQFVFAPMDSCGHQETIVTKQYAFTEGAFREPCCLPGWALDAPAYTRCMTHPTDSSFSSLMSNNPACSVVTTTTRTTTTTTAKAMTTTTSILV